MCVVCRMLCVHRCMGRVGIIKDLKPIILDSQGQASGHHFIVSAHRWILGLASVVCVLVKICVSSISLYKLHTDKLTAPFESAHQFTLVCTVSDSKTVPGCHYNLCSNHSFVVTD